MVFGCEGSKPASGAFGRKGPLAAVKACRVPVLLRKGELPGRAMVFMVKLPVNDFPGRKLYCSTVEMDKGPKTHINKIQLIFL